MIVKDSDLSPSRKLLSRVVGFRSAHCYLESENRSARTLGWHPSWQLGFNWRFGSSGERKRGTCAEWRCRMTVAAIAPDAPLPLSLAVHPLPSRPPWCHRASANWTAEIRSRVEHWRAKWARDCVASRILNVFETYILLINIIVEKNYFKLLIFFFFFMKWV